MFSNRARWLLPVAFRVHKRPLETLSMARNDLSQMASLPPKQLGKIALDVARFSGSDIRIWKRFVDCCTVNVESFDSKDTLRLWKGVGVFYRNYNYRLREPDIHFIVKLLLHAQTVCNGYTCDQLSQLAEVVCDFALENDQLIEITTSLFSKIAVLFNIRLAEAMPYGVVRLLVAFSRLGISDPDLLDSLATFICNNEGFTAYDLRNVLTSYALMGYRSSELLKHATDQFLLLSDMSTNDLAILSFVYSTLDYRTDDVRSLFQRYIEGMDIAPEIGGSPAEGHAVDLPSFCIFLDCLGVSIPEHILRRIELSKLSRDAFFKVVHLLPSNVECQRQVLERYCEFESDGTLENHLNILKYITGSGFELRDFFNRICSNIALHRRDLTVGHCDAVSSGNSNPFYGLDAEATTQPIGHSLGTVNDPPAVNAQIIGKSGIHKLRVEDAHYATIDKDRTAKEMVRLLLLAPAVWVSECVDIGDFAVLMSKGLVDGNQELEDHLEAISNSYGTTLLDVIGSHLSKNGVCRSPRILCAELERCLGDELTVPSRIGDMTVVAVLKAYNIAILPLYPEDFVRLHNRPSEGVEPWSPPGSAARADVYAAIYYLRRHGLRVSPITYSFWSEDANRGSGVLDRLLSRSL